MPFKPRRTADLREGRLSVPGARYFLTWCTANRAHSLAGSIAQVTARHALENLEESGNGVVLAATIMPDHIHLLLELGTSLSVSQVVGKAKSGIARTQGEVKWQENFFEHRLRSNDSSEPFAFYLFMNPYCANLCSLDKTWSGWIPSRNVRWTFEGKLRDGGAPQPEWLAQANAFGTTLPRGAD